MRGMGFRDQVFVYGTLRRGCSNHHCMKGATLLGRHRTAPVYRMLDLGPYPAVVEGEEPITGEVYSVTAAMLRQLDRLEDHPRTYTRSRIHTPWGDAWIYLYRKRCPQLPPVPGGDWLGGSVERPEFRSRIRRADEQ